jgi:small ligand-binding sensory domain FIST
MSTGAPRFAAALSIHPDPAAATGEVLGQVMDRLGTQPEVAVLFATASHVPRMDQIASTVQTVLDPAAFVGATAAGVVQGAQGVEDGPALALWAGRLSTAPHPFHLRLEQAGSSWQVAGLDPARLDGAGAVLVLADPFTFPAREFLDGFGGPARPLPVIGGLASAADQAGGNRLVIGGRVVRHGAVGILLDPADAPAMVVSQGCRPVGQPLTVTRAERNVLYELAGQPAYRRVMEMVEALDPGDRGLALQGLHCGIVVDEHRLDFERGDFLIRPVLGADPDTGAVAVGEMVPLGSTVQFQVRDAATAGEDLTHLLTDRLGGDAGVDGAGVLLFTCNGRGASMFGTPHHDPELIDDLLGAPLAGMFCAGEIGPVGDRNALHGFTASVAVFR